MGKFTDMRNSLPVGERELFDKAVAFLYKDAITAFFVEDAMGNLLSGDDKAMEALAIASDMTRQHMAKMIQFAAHLFGVSAEALVDIIAENGGVGFDDDDDYSASSLEIDSLTDMLGGIR